MTWLMFLKGHTVLTGHGAYPPEKVTLDSCPTTFWEIETRQITELIVKWKTIEFLEDKVGEHLCDLEVGTSPFNKTLGILSM